VWNRTEYCSVLKFGQRSIYGSFCGRSHSHRERPLLLCLSVCLSAIITAVPTGLVYVEFIWAFL